MTVLILLKIAAPAAPRSGTQPNQRAGLFDRNIPKLITHAIKPENVRSRQRMFKDARTAAWCSGFRPFADIAQTHALIPYKACRSQRLKSGADGFRQIRG